MCCNKIDFVLIVLNLVLIALRGAFLAIDSNNFLVFVSYFLTSFVKFLNLIILGYLLCFDLYSF